MTDQATTSITAIHATVSCNITGCTGGCGICQPTPTVEGSGRTEPESAIDRFERLADAFHTDTGLMAPGKDVSAAMGADNYKARAAAWRAWQRGRTYGLEEAREKLEALASSPTAARGVTGLPTWEELERLVGEACRANYRQGLRGVQAAPRAIADERALLSTLRPLLSAAEQTGNAGYVRALRAHLDAALDALAERDPIAAAMFRAGTPTPEQHVDPAAEQGERDREDAERYRRLAAKLLHAHLDRGEWVVDGHTIGWTDDADLCAWTHPFDETTPAVAQFGDDEEESRLLAVDFLAELSAARQPRQAGDR